MAFITKEQLYSSADIKAEAKAQLDGRWRGAILLNLVPIIITIFITGGSNSILNLTVDPWSSPWLQEIALEWRGLIEFLLNFVVVSISFTFLDMIRKRNYQITPLRDAFQVFTPKYFIPILLINLVSGLFIFLWALLLIVPGIIKGFAYSQAHFIYKDLRDEPNEEFPSVMDCLRESESLMKGNKMDLFLLYVSFIGWFLLEVITLGIASFYVRPYLRTAEAIFYENISNGLYVEAANPDKVYSKESVERSAGIDPDDFSDLKEDDDFSDY